MKNSLAVFTAVFCLMILIICCTCSAFGQQADAIILSELKPTSDGTMLVGTVSIHFNNEQLYNENVFLSWHIYLSDGTELQFENQRNDFELQNGEATVPVSIKLPELYDKTICVRFDMVDEVNLYWFADNKNIITDFSQYDYTMPPKPVHVVKLTTDIPDIVYQKQIDGNIFVEIEDASLYNELVKLSWHIIDSNGNNLVYENERIPFTVDDSGCGVVPVLINLNQIDAKGFSVVFDLVDEANAYWFSISDNIDFQTVKSTYKYNLLKSMVGVMKNVVIRQPVILIVNIAVDAMLIWLAVTIIKKRVFKD